ncbi:MAG: Cof-type HAD-IIB family hydrolase [Litorilinea sp.]
MISILALDLDDTLVRSDQTVSPRTLDLLQRWEAMGNRIVIATGRSPRKAREIPAALHHLPWVCYNGGVVLVDGETVYSRTLTTTTAHQLLDYYQNELKLSWVGLAGNDRLFVNRARHSNDPTYVPDMLTVAHEPAMKIYVPLDEFQRHHPTDTGLPAGCRLLPSEKYNFAQIMPDDVSKAAGLRVLAAQWGVSMDEFMAFGDDTNDIEMVREAGIGVAMDNAIPELKAVADRVTLSHDEEGVALVLEEFVPALTA